MKATTRNIEVYIQASGDEKLSMNHTKTKRYGVGIVLRDCDGLELQRQGRFCGTYGDIAILQALLEIAQEYGSSRMEAYGISPGFWNTVKPGGHLDGWQKGKPEGRNAKGKPVESYEEWKKLRSLLDADLIALSTTTRKMPELDAAQLLATKTEMPFEFLPNQGHWDWASEWEPYQRPSAIINVSLNQ